MSSDNAKALAALGLGMVALEALSRRAAPSRPTQAAYGRTAGIASPVTAEPVALGPDPRTLMQLWGVDFDRFDPATVVAVLPKMAPGSDGWLLSGLTPEEGRQVAEARKPLAVHCDCPRRT